MPSVKNSEIVQYQSGGGHLGRRVEEAEEEWVTKKKVEITTTKNVERKIHRQLVLEDGRVVEEEVPTVTNDTTEDKQTFETDQDEDRNLQGGVASMVTRQAKGEVLLGDKFTSVKRVNDVKENLVKTEAVQNLGGITKKDATKVLRDRDDIRKYIRTRDEDKDNQIVVAPRTVYQARNHRVVTDKEDVQERNWVNNGKMHNERVKTEEHIEYDSDDTPDSGSSSSVTSHVKLDPEVYKTRKDEKFTEYYKVGRGDKAPHVKVGDGQHHVSESKEVHRREDNQVLDRRNKTSRHLPRSHRLAEVELLDRPNKTGGHNSRKEITRTDTWLERHFGSSSSSSSSVDMTRPESRETGGLRRSSSICDIRPVDNSSGVYYATVRKSGKVSPAVVLRDKKENNYYKQQNRQSADFSSTGHPIRPPRRNKTGGRSDYKEYNESRGGSNLGMETKQSRNIPIERPDAIYSSLQRTGRSNKQVESKEKIYADHKEGRKVQSGDDGRSSSANITEKYYFGHPVTVKKNGTTNSIRKQSESVVKHNSTQSNLARQSKQTVSTGNIYKASRVDAGSPYEGGKNKSNFKGLRDEPHHLSFGDLRLSGDKKSKYRSSGDTQSVGQSPTPQKEVRSEFLRQQERSGNKETHERKTHKYEEVYSNSSKRTGQLQGTKNTHSRDRQRNTDNLNSGPHRILYTRTDSPLGSPSTKYRTKIVINGPG